MLLTPRKENRIIDSYYQNVQFAESGLDQTQFISTIRMTEKRMAIFFMNNGHILHNHH